MNRYDALENFLYGWVLRHAPHVSRDALDALIDNATDFCRDAERGETTAPTEKSDWDEFLSGWADPT